jgi:hypothetical protein
MKTEDRLFLAFALAVLASGAVFYEYEASKEAAQGGAVTKAADSQAQGEDAGEINTPQEPAVSVGEQSHAPAGEEAARSPQETRPPENAASYSTLPASGPPSSTTLAPPPSPALEPSTTTTQATAERAGAARFFGRGLRQAYLRITYFCPSCVPAVANTVSKEPGVLSKSLSYRQQVSWIIYDPGVVKLERVVELAGASGGAVLINDTAI